MNEATLRNYIRKGLHVRGVLTTHHEDMLITGLPDLSYSHSGVHGWIELKWLEHWPHRATTPVRLSRYTKEQKHFLLSRGRVGGRCWLLLRVGTEHLLFDHERAQHVDTMPRAWLEANATLHNTTRSFDFETLIKRLTQ